MTKIEVPDDHPRKVSLDMREKIIEGHTLNIVATAGLLAHGRGEAFDYIIGERTDELAVKAIRAAVAALLLAKHPIISVNGNVCSLVPEDLVIFSELVNAPLEINLFYYRREREDNILNALHDAGARDVLGTHDRPSETISKLSHNRRKVDTEGIGAADVVVVPLEDGDRTQALRAVGKYIITIDLNPMSRTAIYSNITIVDNIVRTMPLMVEHARELKTWNKEDLQKLVSDFDNEDNLRSTIQLMMKHLEAKSNEPVRKIPEEK